MTNNKTINLIISIVLAILLWVYVVGQVNPTSKETIKDVRIELRNVEVLEEANYVIVSQDIDKVSVVINGKKNALHALKDGDISAYCDVSNLGEGEYRVNIEIKVPDGIGVESMNTQTVRLDVEKVVSASKPIKFVIINDQSDETEPYILQTTYDDILVTGARSLVSKVDAIKVTIDTEKLTTDLQTYSLGLTPIDESGKEVAGVTLGKESVSVAALILGKKTVALDVPVIGESDAQYTRSVKVPRVITVKGFKSTLDGIDSISAKTINVQNIIDDTDILIEPNLPDGVEVCVESENIVAKVTVTPNN